ncbi:hypothetical protein MBLNU459_g0418t2 [Dothideomycetes sp. NU459]
MGTGRSEDAQEAITEEEMTELIVKVTELMSRKPKPPLKHVSTRPRVFYGRDGLGAYTEDPDSFDRVFHKDDKAVFINDMYPKSSVHTLVLPRSERKHLHPFDAFEDPTFLAEIKIEVEKAKQMVAGELRRLYGKFSKSDQPRLQAMESDDPPEQLPEGRDWSKEIITGIHTIPSMAHLHVHVMSRDMVNDCLRRHGHYLSFTTPFLVRLDEFPLSQNDIRRSRSGGGYLDNDLVCWRCGKDFGRKLSKLKQHLEDEFEEWKRE